MRDEVYAQYSEERDNWLKRGRLRLIEVLMRSLPRPTGEAAILEIGAGVGQNVPTLQRFGVVDASESAPMGLAALAAVPGIRRIYDEPVPFACEARYDVVGAFDVIEHLEDDHAALKVMTLRIDAADRLAVVHEVEGLVDLIEAAGRG
jgi:SAM-dependent methyltransferase